MRKHRVSWLLAGMVLLAAASWATPGERILVFSKTAAFRHGSIEDGIEAIRRLGSESGFDVDATEDAAAFTEENLSQYAAVVFLSTTGDVLDDEQQSDFERFIQAGGGYVGVHAAADTEYAWAWYGELVGAYFAGHPRIQQAALNIVDRSHPATEHLDATWQRTDEWYDFRSINPDTNVLITIDESSYDGASTGEPHPMAWYHEFDGGRAFYTALGHTSDSYADPEYLQHLLGGIRYAIGDEASLDLTRARSERPPGEDRFTKVVLDATLTEPTELTVLPDGSVIYIERHGAVKHYQRVRPNTLRSGSSGRFR